MPAVAVPGGAAQRGTAVATDPDRRMWLLHRLRQALDALEAVELAAERRRTLRPQRLEDAQVLVADGAAAVEVGGAEGGELLPRSEEHTSELQSPYDLVC